MMDGPGFTHLHVHSHYSLLAGTASVEALAARAAAEGFSHLALTDSHALYGAVAFARACSRRGVQPIVGMAAPLAPLEGGGLSLAGVPELLILLATGPEGYRNLCRLSTALQGSPERGRLRTRGLSLASLAEHAEGLICLSGGRGSWVERWCRAGERKRAYDHVGRLAAIYGENLLLSLELHAREDEDLARQVVEIGEGLGVLAVAVHPVYTLEADERDRLRLLAAIRHNCRLEEVPAEAIPGRGAPEVEVHWLGDEEMAARFTAFPEAHARVGEVAARCGPVLPEGTPIWPALELPPGSTPGEELRALAWRGLEERFAPSLPEVAAGRLEHELDAIDGYGYAPLFLVVADIVRFAKGEGIPVSTRGSVANSLVAYCLGITGVDPLAHDLLFERFLNPARRDLPDIDLDFCSRRRDEVLAYVREAYGSERVALVGTVSTMRPRGAVRETAKAYDLTERATDRLLQALPRGRRSRPDLEEVLAKLDEGGLHEVACAAFELLGQPHHLSVHPGGVVITPGPLTDCVPVQWAPKGFLVTQYDHRDVGALGLPKLDLLGIRALTVLADAAALVRRDHDPDFQLESIPMEDERTGDLLARGDTLGIFQSESLGAQRTLRRLKARDLRQLAIANAFWRPGPSTGGMARAFVRRVRGEEPVAYLHPALEPILGGTRGVLIFQEQVLRIAREIAGLSWEEADRIRRGISKHGAQGLAEMEAQFLQGCRRRPPEGPGMTQAAARRLWEQVAAFSGFGFNKGHATAYAEVSYRSAYLKAHWPAAFLCARLADRGGYHHPAVYMAEAVRLGIAVRPPHVNRSGKRFSLTWDGPESQPTLWMGLDQVRDLRADSIRDLLEGRRERPFEDLDDLLGRVSLGHKEIVHLIRGGGLDGLSQSRLAMEAEVGQRFRAGSPLQRALPFLKGTPGEAGPAQILRWEREVLGMPVSVHPLQTLEARPEHVPLRELESSGWREVAALGVRLPGWTAREAFYLEDGERYVLVRWDSRPLPPPWRPLVVHGRWSGDGMGTWWLQASTVEELQPASGHEG